MDKDSKVFIFGSLFGGLTMLFALNIHDRNQIKIEGNEFVKSAKVYSILDSGAKKNIDRDTVIVLPLNLSDEFSNEVKKIINEKQWKIIHFDFKPK